jgi:hypothetical protein
MEQTDDVGLTRKLFAEAIFLYKNQCCEQIAAEQPVELRNRNATGAKKLGRFAYFLLQIISSLLQGFHTTLLLSLVFEVYQLSCAAQPACQEPGNV